MQVGAPRYGGWVGGALAQSLRMRCQSHRPLRPCQPEAPCPCAFGFPSSRRARGHVALPVRRRPRRQCRRAAEGRARPDHGLLDTRPGARRPVEGLPGRSQAREGHAVRQARRWRRRRLVDRRRRRRAALRPILFSDTWRAAASAARRSRGQRLADTRPVAALNRGPRALVVDVSPICPGDQPRRSTSSRSEPSAAGRRDAPGGPRRFHSVAVRPGCARSTCDYGFAHVGSAVNGGPVRPLDVRRQRVRPMLDQVTPQHGSGRSATRPPVSRTTART